MLGGIQMVGRLVMMGIALLALNASAEELYRWVDKDGKVHFGDRPPVEAKAESLEGRLKPVNSAAPTRKQDFPDRSRAGQIEREYAARKQSEQSKARQQRQIACARARKQLKILKGPVYFVDAEGNESTISERQRQVEARKLEARVRQYCG
ncbi:DUF4124 domain-containing protein [Microbulbifer hydrolyticus]|uniref:DUF4124 domain-containing protein n=1 Tax=Microbulbifer hydrolyticus TaxID=48074 RepID=A0A6P1T7C6_9GAMM|nr:DUF4124 domain-containing protein [Microbulbifer hydrolyticus]MBB5211559.1 hypothetical protein [Microbulbifer hydrolyticus]QHQ37701.1 DUF4124 domain-containing protein [Microbulbifer hydrolyticus]